MDKNTLWTHDKMNTQTTKTEVVERKPQGGVVRQAIQESYVQNMTETPIGRLLGVISALPEIRTEKVDRLRDEIRSGRYNLQTNLDVALDRVIDELLFE